MALTKKQFNNCLKLINLLETIIKKNLPYDQNVSFQGSDGKRILDFKELAESGRTCCLLGYVSARFKQYYLNPYELFGFTIFEITTTHIDGKTYKAKEALEWFKKEFYLAVSEE